MRYAWVAFFSRPVSAQSNSLEAISELLLWECDRGISLREIVLLHRVNGHIPIDLRRSINLLLRFKLI
jgi:hypothetical protein